MPKLIDKQTFFKQMEQSGVLLLDARSPKEYLHAHIPSAFNVPLLNDEQREKVGITYKNDGRNAAVLKGFELVGPHFAGIIKQVKAMGEDKELLIYCWRGGMRSGILSWLLSTAGFKVTVLEGGYKSYRSLVLDTLEMPRRIIVLGGKTGSGKTELLEHLRNCNEQIIDLEKLAAHKGSSFGALGQQPQPTNEHFENLLFRDLVKLDINRDVWVENESRSIGSVKIPDPFFNQMKSARVLAVDIPLQIRKERILHEYGKFPIGQLKECTTRLERRLGGLRLKLCVQALEENRKEEWLDYLLEYYDETYSYGMSLRDNSMCTTLSLNEGERFADFAKRIKEMKDGFLQTLSK